LTPIGGSQYQTVIIKIENGDSLNRIAGNLESQGLVVSRLLFKWGAVLLGKGKSIKTGEYEIKGTVSAYSLIQLLSSGAPNLKRITIPEGLRMNEIFELLSQNGFGKYEDYIELSQQPEFIKSLLGRGITSLEGFLFPETYLFSKYTSATNILRAMVTAFFANVPEDYEQQAKGVGLSYYEAVILASIIEKETGVASERGVIASVFHNRLKQNMKLQTDPTVIYGIADFDGNLTRRQLRTMTRYNTYLIHGLPPTPIACPGLAALLAAVQPAETDYLYFVAKGDGTHEFTSKYTDHRKAVARYQKRRIKNYRSF